MHVMSEILQAKEKRIEVDISKLTMDHVPRSLAARDTRGFIIMKEKDIL